MTLVNLFVSFLCWMYINFCSVQCCWCSGCP